MNWQGKRSLVVGGGKSGLAAAEKLRALGAQVYLTDMKDLDELPGVAELQMPSSHLYLGKMAGFREIMPEILILSPGVPTDLPLIQEALEAQIPVWGEVELALSDCPAFRIGVTGTNGKTTTTALIGELAKRTGRPVVVAGNIGVALSGQVESLGEDGLVTAELSSFQLEYIDRLKMNVAVILNITPDHLDRHKTLERYVAAKARILENQGENDAAVLNWDDPLVRPLGEGLKCKVIYFSPTTFLAEGISVQDSTIVWAEKGQVIPVIRVNELQLRGAHNLENVMAAVAAVRQVGLDWDSIAQGLREFSGIAHRQEVVGRFDDILYINDSKGTNPDAAVKALLAFDESIVLIAGGKNKGLSFDDYMQVVKQKVKSLILLGMAAEDMEKAARKAGVEQIIRADSFKEGVEAAIGEARAGDVVLLSPACTSWDMFKSYEERGELFKELVRTHYSEPKTE